MELARLLLTIGAIQLSPKNPFIWSSGIQSPIYCDNRLNISYTENRNFIVEKFLEIIHNKFSHVTLIAGTSTAGIPWAAIIADRLQLPMVYVRGESKSHGTKKRIEGKVQDNDIVLVIEDLLSTGKSSRSVIDAFGEESKAQVVGLLAIFSYEIAGVHESFENHYSLLPHTLLNRKDLLLAAVHHNFISSQESEDIHHWLDTLAL